MSIIQAPSGHTHDLGGVRFTSLATPSRGSTETAVWQVEIEPGTPATPHSLSHEEVFVVLYGTASVRIGDEAGVAVKGDAIVVPRDTEFELANNGDEMLRLMCCLPVGGQARVGDMTFTPPWAL
ncbi:cupin domain-containing protein [Mesorhizobium sp. KR9-304]|jgi:quercetin dioxygenase-like cupin family protein|uniref:cupin domain-containing protein n=1 Tax=Mesorhizobium sp. KR9-304 TaxID=3156614 RepID=UPI0032B60D62